MAEQAYCALHADRTIALRNHAKRSRARGKARGGLAPW